MKKLIQIFILLCFVQGLYAQQADTLNKRDNNGLKQGHWVLLGESKPNTCYKPDQKVEEGDYKDNKKNGLWTEYFCNGKTKNNIEFKAGKPNGKAIMFYQNGTVSEIGTFVLNKWVGQYFLYFDNGRPQQIFTFKENGKRDSLQKHYFHNGRMQGISMYIDTKDYATLLFDTLGALEKTILNGKVIHKGDNLSKEDKNMLKDMMDIATNENKLIPHSKEIPKKKTTEKNNNLQDINLDPKEIQKRN